MRRLHPSLLPLLTISIAVLGLVGSTRVSALNVRLFLVAENPALVDPCFHCDSYVLPLSDPADIQQARAIIERGGTGGGTIVVAGIAAGADDINRNLRAPEEPFWSWHVTQFGGFAEFVIEILDGTPTTVESDVDGWIANTGGAIGFWAYTVVEEVPEPSSAALHSAALVAVALLARAIARRERAGPKPSSDHRAAQQAVSGLLPQADSFSRQFRRRRSDCSRISGLGVWSARAPGHDGKPRAGANR